MLYNNNDATASVVNKQLTQIVLRLFRDFRNSTSRTSLNWWLTFKYLFKKTQTAEKQKQKCFRLYKSTYNFMHTYSITLELNCTEHWTMDNGHPSRVGSELYSVLNCIWPLFSLVEYALCNELNYEYIEQWTSFQK